MEKGDDGDEDKEKYARESMGKSFEGAVQESETLQKGIEVSEFLTEFAKAFATGLSGLEDRMAAYVDSVGQGLSKSLTEFAKGQDEFNGLLANAVANIGHGVDGAIKQAQEVAQQPVGAPRSQHLQVMQGGQQQGYINKSFEGPQGGENISKAMVAGTLQDMLEKGDPDVNATEIIKFDTTGTLRPELQQKVMARIQGAGR
jgi:hypothetical protein